MTFTAGMKLIGKETKKKGGEPQKCLGPDFSQRGRLSGKPLTFTLDAKMVVFSTCASQLIILSFSWRKFSR